MANDYAEILRVGRTLIDEIKREERLQGHHLTGELERSMQSTTQLQRDLLVMEGQAAGYIQSLEERTEAHNVSVTEEERQKLIVWVRRRGLDKKPGRQLRRLTSGSGTYTVQANAAEQIADAIIRSWERTGRPTENSKQFSQTGERTGAVETVLERNSERVYEMLSAAIDKTFEPVFNELQSEEV